jgi:transposase-like protein
MAVVMRYSEAFKIQVVEDLARGRFGSPFEAAQAHGIGRDSVRRWVKQSGQGHLLKRVVRVSKKDEPGEMKRLKERNRKLEAALVDLHLDAALDSAFFELLCEAKGVDPEEFKKKHAGEVSAKRKKKRKDGLA